jgi:hypothetical protein
MFLEADTEWLEFALKVLNHIEPMALYSEQRPRQNDFAIAEIL